MDANAQGIHIVMNALILPIVAIMKGEFDYVIKRIKNTFKSRI